MRYSTKIPYLVKPYRVMKYFRMGRHTGFMIAHAEDEYIYSIRNGVIEAKKKVTFDKIKVKEYMHSNYSYKDYVCVILINQL